MQGETNLSGRIICKKRKKVRIRPTQCSSHLTCGAYKKRKRHRLTRPYGQIEDHILVFIMTLS